MLEPSFAAWECCATLILCDNQGGDDDDEEESGEFMFLSERLCVNMESFAAGLCS